MIVLPLVGYEGLYSATEDGDIISLPKSTSKKLFPMKKNNINNSGYVCMVLCKDGKHKTHTLHSLIALTFLGERLKGYDIDHINGNKLDNRVSNLRYVTHRYNMENAVRNGFNIRGEKSHFSKLGAKSVHDIRQETGRLIDIAKKYNVTEATISRIKSYKTWRDVS